MAKRILIVNGSPRLEGNTKHVCRWVAEGARSKGAEVEIVDAGKLKPKAAGCTACLSCQVRDDYRCVIDDDVTPLVATFPEQDMVIFASPIYFMGVTAQLKVVIDRMFSLIRMNAESGEYNSPMKDVEIGLIATAGGDEGGGLAMTEKHLQMIAAFIHQKLHCLKVPLTPMDPAELESTRDVKARALAFGEGLA